MVERKGFDALLAAAEAGRVDAIIARHHDRLTRNLKDYDRLIEVCARRGVMVHYYTGGALDFRTSEGGFMGTINTAIAQRESDIGSERVSAAVERNVRLGKRTGGGSRAFGYKIIDGRRHYTIRAIPYQDPQARGGTAQGCARGSGQDRPQGVSSSSVVETDLGDAHKIATFF